CFVVTGTVDNERVAFPMSDRVSQISLAVDLIETRMRTTVHIDLTPNVRSAFVDHDDAILFRKLDDLHRERSRHETRPARRQTIPYRVELRQIRRVVVVQSGCPRLEWNVWLGRSAFTQVASKILRNAARNLCEIRNNGKSPNTFFAVTSPKIDGAVFQSRRGF